MRRGDYLLVEKILLLMNRKTALQFTGRFFWFARHGGHPQPALSWRHPDQGEDNPNRKGVAGNG